jgi:hypothetical protein
VDEFLYYENIRKLYINRSRKKGEGREWKKGRKNN